ncbi:MAG: sugar phosphate isomerase/epimerase [Clostridia bacterium]|nr:sugar phosphate isomerase/epimerase [Clostridia bacterium]
MYPVGLSSSFFSAAQPISFDVWFSEYEKGGITHFELSFGAEKDHDALILDGIGEAARAHGVTLWSYHLPFLPFEKLDPSSPNEEMRRYTVGKFTDYMKAAAPHGFSHFVFHASGEPIADADRAAHLEAAKRSVRELCQTAGDLGVTLCVEDLPRSCIGHDSGEILALLEADSRLRVVFDTNHLTKQDNAEFVRAVGEKIVTTHVSDYDLIDERHVLPGEGKADFSGVLKALSEVGYRGPWLYELSAGSTGRILRPVPLTASDVYENAAALFEGRKPAVLGKILF